MTNRLDRRLLRMRPLSERRNLLDIRRIAVSPDQAPTPMAEAEQASVNRLAQRIIAARAGGSAVILTFGAHLVKNGLGPVMVRLIEEGWVTHVATNGAGSIHDWEFAHIGESSEDVRENVARGQFGAWEETGKLISLAVLIGGAADLGYGWSVGRMIAEDGLGIPTTEDLRTRIAGLLKLDSPGEDLGALSDALAVISDHCISPGFLEAPHPFKRYSIQNAAWANQVPFTVHPGIGYDIIHTHPACSGGAFGRGAMRDFLSLAESVSKIGGGVHLAVGSSVMAPMVFEKSMSMANNKAIIETGRPIDDHYMAVVDIQDGGGWDWSQGEPPKDNPAYYLRFCKSFYRMGGTLDYICADNRQFLLNLYSEIKAIRGSKS